MSGNMATRREFLRATGALVVYAATTRGFPAEPLPRSLAANPNLDTWIRIDINGRISVFSGKCELGQGIRTALAQIVAEELDVAIERIDMQTVDTAHSPNEGRTVGSNSLVESGAALRVAAAEARQILVANASQRLGVRPERLSVTDGRVEARGAAGSVSYWELLSSNELDVTISGDAAPKRPETYRYVGKPVGRIDLAAKFFGEPAFIHDIELPGMLHARIVRASMPGSRLREIDEAPVRALPGVVTIVRNGNFLAVVARAEAQAVTAARALAAAAVWQTSRYPATAEIPGLIERLPTEDTVIKDSRARAGPSVRELGATYTRPFIAHASLAPSAALAIWDGERLTVWSHAQGMYPLRDAIASVTGVERERVRCIHADGAGCYGHNGADDAACDAALIAMAVQDAPIRLVWSREDEFRHEPYGSAMRMQVVAELDAADRIVDWRYELWSCSHSTRPAGGEAAGGLLAAREKTEPLPLPRVSDPGQPAGGADRNAIPIYAIPDQRIVEHLILEPPLRNSALRSLGAHGNVFAIESFIDEIAHALDADPIEFRLRHLDDERGRAVIEAVRDLAARRSLRSTGETESAGRGIAFARYKNSSTYLAIVADVAVDETTRKIRLEHVFAAVDAGQVVNPDGLRNQIEGGIVQAASWTLKEQVTSSAAGIESIDWATYPILRFDEVPEIEVAVLDRPSLPFVGAGEAAQGPTAAAIANGVADATGIRLRDLPLVLAGLRLD